MSIKNRLKNNHTLIPKKSNSTLSFSSTFRYFFSAGFSIWNILIFLMSMGALRLWFNLISSSVSSRTILELFMLLRLDIIDVLWGDIGWEEMLFWMDDGMML